jgi:hypothetical protein
MEQEKIRRIHSLRIFIRIGFVLGIALISRNNLVNAQGNDLPPIFTPIVQDRFQTDKYCGLVKEIYAAYDSGDFLYVKKMKAKYKKDFFLFPTCQLLLYLDKKISTKELINSFPGNKKDFLLFTGGTWGCESPCKIYGESRVGNPFEVYYEELFKLMKKGNRQAMFKVLNSVTWADGHLTEYLCFELPGFVTEHADIVVKNWDLFKNHYDSECVAYSAEKLLRMKKVVLSTEADETSKNEFIHAIDEDLKIINSVKKDNSRKKKAVKKSTPIY